MHTYTLSRASNPRTDLSFPPKDKDEATDKAIYSQTFVRSSQCSS